MHAKLVEREQVELPCLGGLFATLDVKTPVGGGGLDLVLVFLIGVAVEEDADVAEVAALRFSEPLDADFLNAQLRSSSSDGLRLESRLSLDDCEPVVSGAESACDTSFTTTVTLLTSTIVGSVLIECSRAWIVSVAHLAAWPNERNQRKTADSRYACCCCCCPGGAAGGAARG